MTSISRRNFLIAAPVALGAATLAQSALADGHATTHTVLIKGFAFEPANLTINAGDTVVFVNEDNAPHTATADNGTFDTGRLGRGSSAGLTFQNAGTFGYFCAVHPSMKGSITVS